MLYPFRVRLCCITSLSRIYHLYRDPQFYWWRKPDIQWKQKYTCVSSIMLHDKTYISVVICATNIPERSNIYHDGNKLHFEEIMSALYWSNSPQVDIILYFKHNWIENRIRSRARPECGRSWVPAQVGYNKGLWNWNSLLLHWAHIINEEEERVVGLECATNIPERSNIYHDGNKLHFEEIMSALYWSNSPQVDMSLHSDTLL
jgi:hypothetical protein